MILSLVIDITAFSVAFTVIFTSINRCKKNVYLQVFMAALLVESAFVICGLQMFSLLPVMTVEAFIAYRQDKKLNFSFFSAFLTVFFLTIVVVITAIPISAFLPQDSLYNCLISLIVVLYSFLCRLLMKKYFPRRMIDNVIILIIINIIGGVIMVFISIIAPLFLLYDKDTLPFYIMFTVFLVYIMKEETEKTDWSTIN